MLKKLKVLSIFLVFFFMLPIITGLLPFPNNEKYKPPIAEEKQVVYASTDVKAPEVASEELATAEAIATDVAPSMDSFDVLFVYTHSHETYKPFLKNANGSVEVYDDQTNLFSMKTTMEDYFRLNGLNAKTLDVDVMSLNKQNGLMINASYDTVRPYIKNELAKNDYDLILDIHRDSLKGDRTTVDHKDVGYAKIAFVIGAENPNYKTNLSYANAISQSLNKIIPNISRGIIEKQGKGVDGVYNQDLADNLLLIEVGGIDNTEDEVYRTMAVLAQAISKAYIKTEENV